MAYEGAFYVANGLKLFVIVVIFAGICTALMILLLQRRLKDIISRGGEEDRFLLVIEPSAYRFSWYRFSLAACVLLLLEKYLIFLLGEVSLCDEHLLSKLVPLRGGTVGKLLRYEVLGEGGHSPVLVPLLLERRYLIHGLALRTDIGWPICTRLAVSLRFILAISDHTPVSVVSRPLWFLENYYVIGYFEATR